MHSSRRSNHDNTRQHQHVQSNKQSNTSYQVVEAHRKHTAAAKSVPCSSNLYLVHTRYTTVTPVSPLHKTTNKRGGFFLAKVVAQPSSQKNSIMQYSSNTTAAAPSCQLSRRCKRPWLAHSSRGSKNEYITTPNATVGHTSSDLIPRTKHTAAAKSVLL